jgi:hypothetical protein
VLAGDTISVSDRTRLERAMGAAEKLSGLTFSLYLGVSEEDARNYAQRLHAALAEPARSVLVMCDPEFRALEIVTGAQARRTLADAECALAAASMESSFVAGDIIGGLVAGLTQLGEAARVPPTLHARHQT